MAIKLEDSGARPKSNAGRKAKPLDDAFIKALNDAFSSTPTVDVEGEARPRMLGPDTEFATKGKATSEGRRYQQALEKLGTKIRVTAVAVGDTGKWKWRGFVPLATAE